MTLFKVFVSFLFSFPIQWQANVFLETMNGMSDKRMAAVFSVYVPMLMCDIRDISLFIMSFSINAKWHQNNRIVDLQPFGISGTFK